MCVAGREGGTQAGASKNAPQQCLQLNVLCFFSLPSCSDFQVLHIFQISNKPCSKKQTLLATSKGKRSVHHNETAIFY